MTDDSHRHFSAECFNEAWDHLDMKSRTREEDVAMLAASYASLWHWSKRADRKDENLSVAHWQLSRIYAVLGDADWARKHGEMSLKYAGKPGAGPFFLAYAHEALARASAVGGDADASEKHLALAREALARVEDVESRKMVEADIDGIKP